MFDLAREIIGTQPILAVFLAIGVGYLVGQINLGGFSLGVGAVLFVGLAIGAFAPKAQITGPIGAHRPDHVPLWHRHPVRTAVLRRNDRRGGPINTICWRSSRSSPDSWSRSGSARAFGIKIGHTLGIFAGSMTSTATLQAALDVMGNSEPSIGYSIAYPVRRDRPDPVHLFHDAPGAAEIPAQGAALPHGRDHARGELCGAHARRAQQGPARAASR